jgi:hypothetical protein
MSCSQKFVTEGAVTIAITDRHGDDRPAHKISFIKGRMNHGWEYKVVRPHMNKASAIRLDTPECWPLVAVQDRIRLPGVNEGECVLVSHVRAVEL